jgi:PAS domain S-box-containing protein
MHTDDKKTKAQLLSELNEVRRRLAEVEALEAQRKQVEEDLRESEEKYSTLVEQSTDAVLISQDHVFKFANSAVRDVYGYTVEEMTGMCSIETIAPECGDSILARYRARLSGETVPLNYETRIICKDGTRKDVEVSGRRIQYKGSPAIMAVVRDITHRKRAEERSLQRSRELTALYNVLVSTTQTLDLREVLKEIVFQVGSAVDSAYTAIVLVNQDGSVGIGSEHFAVIEPLPESPLVDAITYRIVRSGRPVVVRDASKAKSISPLLKMAGIRSYAGMPIRTVDVPIGVLFVHGTRPDAFAGSMELLAAFANQAAIAIQNARLYDTIRVERSRVEQLLKQVLTAQEDERGRLSLDLHDTVTQSMYGVLARIGAANELLSRSAPGAAQTELGYAKKAMEQTLADLRRVARNLHPPALDTLGLVEALRQHIDDFALNNRDVDYALTVKGEMQRLPSKLEIGAYRVAQEALSNARRHSGATKVAVRLEFLPSSVRLEVSDNGRGFNFPKAMTDRAINGRMGLAGMIERAEILGGSLRVETSPGAGTRVQLSIHTGGLGGEGIADHIAVERMALLGR